MEFAELFANVAKAGRVTYLSVRPQPQRDVIPLNEVLAVQDTGLEGDRYNSKGGNRQVTLIQAEHLRAVASFMGKDSIDPALTRRNIVVEGINLLSLKGQRFHIGDAVLEYSGECLPCSRMERNLGYGGYNAMRGSWWNYRQSNSEWFDSHRRSSFTGTKRYRLIDCRLA